MPPGNWYQLSTRLFEARSSLVTAWMGTASSMASHKCKGPSWMVQQGTSQEGEIQNSGIVPRCCRASRRTLPRGMGILNQQNLISLLAVDDLVDETSRKQHSKTTGTE